MSGKKLCLFQINITQHIELGGNSSFYVHTAERDVTITLRLLDGAKLFSYTGENYEWLSKEPYCRVKKNNDGTEAVLRNWFKEDDTPNNYGISDPVKYTQIYFVFELENVDLIKNDDSLKVLKKWIEGVLKYFYKYQVVTDDTVEALSSYQLPTIEIFTADNYIFNKVDVEANFKHVKTSINWLPAFYGHLKPKPTKAQMQELGKQLEAGNPIEVFMQLLFEARELSHIKFQHDLSIITIETAFEAFVQSEIIKICQNRQVEALLYGRGKGAKFIPYLEAVELGGLKEYLLEYICFFSGRNIKSGVEYNQWLLNSYENRNNIIHKGMRGFTNEDAGKAFVSAINFINYIRQCLYPSNNIS